MRASDLLKLELQIIVSCRVGGENGILVLWKHSQCSYPLIALSSPKVVELYTLNR